MTDVRWGKYKDYEGPWTPGTQRFTLPESPTFEEEVLAVITATEGGTWGAINRYDKCVDTQGLIQWCNRAPQHSVDDMYGALVKHAQELHLLDDVAGFYGAHGYKFLVHNGKWRWVWRSQTVSTPERQHRLYFLNCNGRRGKWDNESKEYAKTAVALSTKVWDHPTAQKIQGIWTVQRLDWFLLKNVKKLFLDAPDTDVARAFKAMYWSFAANNPAKAAKALEQFLQESAGVYTPWGENWLARCARWLTFFPGITIYPHRYNKIRPVLEKLYGVDLPDYADELKVWQQNESVHKFLEPEELQQALIDLGYDLGPCEADGVPGKKTREALRDFEEDMGVESPDGLIDPGTAHMLEDALDSRGIQAAP